MLAVDLKMCKAYIIKKKSLREFLNRKVQKAGVKRSPWPEINQGAYQDGR